MYSVSVNKFTAGSVVVNSTLNFQANYVPADEKTFLNNLRSAIVSNTSDPFVPINPDSVSLTFGKIFSFKFLNHTNFIKIFFV